MEILTSSQSPNRRDATTGQAGFSLLELLVAMGLLVAFWLRARRR